MPYPTTVRGLLGHFLHSSEPPAVSQRAPPPPVWSPTYISLRTISAAGDGGGGVRGSAVGRKSPMDGGGGGRGEWGRTRDGGGAKRYKAGETRGEREATEKMATSESGRKITMEVPLVVTHDNSAGEKYCVCGTGPEKSADKSVEWSGEETDESSSEEADDNSRGAGGFEMTMTATAKGSEGSGA